jgi:diketogulonate reductase-like aldo/keto reductase
MFPMLPDGSGRDVLFDWKLKDTWKQMEDLLTTGKVKTIGVSNFSQKMLEEEIFPYATVIPAVNQVGPLFRQPIYVRWQSAVFLIVCRWSIAGAPPV